MKEVSQRRCNLKALRETKPFSSIRGWEESIDFTMEAAVCFSSHLLPYKDPPILEECTSLHTPHQQGLNANIFSHLRGVFENSLSERKPIYLVANYFGSGFNEPSTVKYKEDNKAFSLSLVLLYSDLAAMDKSHVELRSWVLVPDCLCLYPCLLGVWPWANCSLCPRVLIHKMRIITVPITNGCNED